MGLCKVPGAIREYNLGESRMTAARNHSSGSTIGDSAQLTVRRFAQRVAIGSTDDLTSSLAAKEAQDEQEERSSASLLCNWQELFRLEKHGIER